MPIESKEKGSVQQWTSLPSPGLSQFWGYISHLLPSESSMVETIAQRVVLTSGGLFPLLLLAQAQPNQCADYCTYHSLLNS